MSTEIDHLRLAAEVADVPLTEVVAPTSRQLLLRNQRFHYLDWGNQDAPAIVFLHGSGLTAHTWDLVCLRLRPYYRCLAFDLRGHGDSEWSRPLDYSLDAHAGDVAAFVDALGLMNPIVVGMSLGGGVAGRYAVAHPPRALVIVDTGPRIDTAGNEGGRALMNFMQQPAELDSIDDFITRAMAFNPRRDPELLRRSLLHNLMQLPNGKWTWKYDRRHHGRQDFPNQDDARRTMWGQLVQLTCPVLIVRGADSPMFSPASAEAFAAAFPDGRLIEIANAGHTVQGDNPRDLSAALLDFFGAVVAGGRG